MLRHSSRVGRLLSEGVASPREIGALPASAVERLNEAVRVGEVAIDALFWDGSVFVPLRVLRLELRGNRVVALLDAGSGRLREIERRLREAGYEVEERGDLLEVVLPGDVPLVMRRR